jgi:hypothetical protein
MRRAEQRPPPPRPEKSFSFRYVRSEGRWGIGLITEPPVDQEGETRIGESFENLHSCYGVPGAATKAEARDLARAFAAKHGFPYAEWVPHPPPTAAETATMRRGSIYRSIRYAEERAVKHEEAEEWEQAAQSWAYAARGCEKAIQAAPGLARHLARCAAERVTRAMKALDRWRVRLRAVSPTDGFKRGGVGGERT